MASTSKAPKLVVLRGLSAEEVAATAPPASPELVARLRDLLGYSTSVDPRRVAS